MFEYRDLGTVSLKGFAENIQAWQMLGASAAESRFEALGRDEEIDLLLRRWQQAKRGDGCAVPISGEPSNFADQLWHSDSSFTVAVTGAASTPICRPSRLI